MSVKQNKYLIILLMIYSSVLTGQNIIVRTNGARIEAKILEISEDSVKFKIYNTPGNAIYYLSKSEVKFIEYNNNKVDYFEGSYKNLSETNALEIVTGFETDDYIIEIEGIGFSIENLFTENHLIMDYTNHPDTNFYAVKGKMEFVFESKKYNFFIRLYPTGEKTMFSKFEFTGIGGNKRYNYLSEQILTELVIYLNDSVNSIELNKGQSDQMRALFSGKNINLSKD